MAEGQPHAGRWYVLVGRRALFDRRQRQGDPAGIASTYPRSLHQVAVEQLLAQHLRSGATCPYDFDKLREWLTSNLIELS